MISSNLSLQNICSKCRKNFKLKWVKGMKRPSFKNNLDYWTELKEHQGKYICNKCLRKLYTVDKKKYWGLVKNKKKRTLLTTYIHEGRV